MKNLSATDILTSSEEDTENLHQEPAVIYSSHQENLFRFYCGELFNRGVLRWGVRSSRKHVILMNDYDSENGNFLQFQYIHISVSSVTNQLVYTCTCKTYSTFRIEKNEDYRCCHCRLLHGLVGISEIGTIDPKHELPEYVNCKPVSWRMHGDIWWCCFDAGSLERREKVIRILSRLSRNYINIQRWKNLASGRSMSFKYLQHEERKQKEYCRIEWYKRIMWSSNSVSAILYIKSTTISSWWRWRRMLLICTST